MVMETSKRKAIHHAWKVVAMTGEGVVSFGFTIYRGKNKVDCLLSEIIKRMVINLSMELPPLLRPSPRSSGILQGVTALPLPHGEETVGPSLHRDL